MDIGVVVSMILIPFSHYLMLFYRLDNKEIKTAITVGFQTLFLLWNLLFLALLLRSDIQHKQLLLFLMMINFLAVLPILRTVVLYWSRKD